MGRLIRALDVSAYSGSIATAAWRKAWDQGWHLAIVQLWGGRPSGVGPNPLAMKQLANARAAGLMTAAYIWLPPDSTTDTSELIALARQAAGAQWENLLFVALDIEDEEHRPLHPTDPLGRLGDAIGHLADVTVGIYTSISMWAVLMGAAAAAGHLFLWDARYDRVADLDQGWVPYGGWARRAIKQYQGTTQVEGISADLNVLDLDRIVAGEPVGPVSPGVPWGIVATIEAAKLALDGRWDALREYLDRHNLGA